MPKSFTQKISKTGSNRAYQRPNTWPQLTSNLSNLDTIALAGAGASSAGYPGALTAFHEAGLLDGVRRFTGNSAGAMVALLAALGYRGKELEDIVISQGNSSFFQMNVKWLKNLSKNMKHHGLFSGKEMHETSKKVCAQRIGLPNLTFEDIQLYRAQANANNRHFFEEKYDDAMRKKPSLKRYGKSFTYDFEKKDRNSSVDAMMNIAKSFRELEVTGTEISKSEDGKRHNKNVIFSFKNSPQFRVSDAVRISASYPFFFCTAEFKDKTGNLRKYTDGALSSLIPLENATKEWNQPNETLWIYSPREESGPVKKTSFLAKRLLVMLAKQIGGEEIKEQHLDGVRPLDVGKTLIQEVKDLHSNQLKNVLSNKDLLSHLLPLGRDGINSGEFSMTKEKKVNLMSASYNTTWKEIERLTDIKKPFTSKITKLDEGFARQ